MKQCYSDEILSAYLDHDLEPEQIEEIGRHIEECSGCRSALEQITAIRDAASSLEQLEPCEKTWFEIQRRVRKGRLKRIWVWSGVGAAAAVVLVVFLVRGRPVQVPETTPAPGRRQVEAGLVQEYDDYMRGIDKAVEECKTALSENPHNPRVQRAYLEARSSQINALDVFTSGGD